MSTGVTTPVSGASLRPLVLAHHGLEHTFLVPTALYANCIQLRDQFLRSLTSENSDNAAAAAQATWTDPVELVGAFLGFTASLVDDQPGPFDDVLTVILNEFESRFLVGNDVHTVAASLDIDAPDSIVRSYFLARQAAARPIRPHVSALLRASEDERARIFAIFGGQGTSEEYFDELRALYTTYPTFVTTFLEQASYLLRNLAAEHPGASKVYSMGMDIMSWLRNPEASPSNEYLVSAPLSVPIIGVIQLAHVVVTCSVLGITPSQFGQHLTGATGHSQGIIPAIIIASCTSWEDFVPMSNKMLTILFLIGLRCQETFPKTSLLPSVLQDSLKNGEGVPSPMLSIRDVDMETLKPYIDQTNKFLPTEKHVSIALINGPRSFVVSGPPMSLYGLNRSLRSEKADASVNQGRTPHSQRKLRIVNRFLPISSPFHSPLLKAATQAIYDDMVQLGVTLNASDLNFAVYDTYDGSDLRDCDELTFRAIKLITELPVRWELATQFPKSTHIVDFGPGGASGMASLTHKNKDGTGNRVIVAGVLGANHLNDDLGFKQELFDRSTNSVVYNADWLEKYSPKLVRTANGTMFVDTKFSRLLGRPHLMVPGMVPATVDPSVVSATLNAGYHIELGGGAYFSPEMLQSALNQIRSTTKPGVGITLNVLYVNPVMLQWCIPLVKQLREDGFPIEGLTIGAGVPSVEVGSEYIRTLGLKHISFKPGSVESIIAAVKIAEENPDFPVIIQWTGGRGGGHHSFEDFHQPILATYSRIRKSSNIILVAGSGFGDAQGTYPYLTGQWSVEFDYPPMPFDGFLFGSRMMVAKEFTTSSAVKRAIVDAAGVPDAQWEGTYRKPTGGVITVLSEMGEPIHKLATRGVMLWKELDDTVFDLPRNKRLPQLLKIKTKLIQKLNDDFQKPWFGKRSSGEVIDLEDMTYSEVLHRLIELMYVSTESRWIDVTLRNMTVDFAKRIEERFTTSRSRESFVQSNKQLDEPHAFFESFMAAFPEATTQVINTQDKDFFLMLCMNPRKKPVPFIPLIDENFEYYFKKDSLWQSQDLAAVTGCDVQRTCILQSPVSVQYSKVVDEPVADILNGINQGHMERLLAEVYGSELARVPVQETFGSPVSPDFADIEYDHPALTVISSPNCESFVLEKDGELPTQDAWLKALAGGQHSWRHAIFSSPRIVQGEKHVVNALRRVFAAERGIKIDIENASDPSKLVVKLYLPSNGNNGTRRQLGAQLWLDEDGIIHAALREHRTHDKKPLDMVLLYRYQPELGYAPISEITDDRNMRIKEFYWKLWFGESEQFAPVQDLAASWSEPEVSVEGKEVREFIHSVGNFGEAYVHLPGKTQYAPMDFAIVIGWKAIIKAIFPASIDGDLLQLVHLSNGFEMGPGAEPLVVGDKVTTAASIKSVMITPAGKVIEVEGLLSRGGHQPVLKVKSRFLYRGSFEDFSTTFSEQDEIPMEITMTSPRDVAILFSKEWFHPSVEQDELLGKTLQFRCQSRVRHQDVKVFEEVITTGRVLHVLATKEIIEVGRVDYNAGRSFGNPVIDYLQRNGKKIEQPVFFEKPHTLSPADISSRAPTSNEPYAEVSGDYNPIHVSPVFANYAGLPGTICHGMYTSANIRALVETWAAENHIGRVRAYNCQFTGMVLPNDMLDTKLQHVGMINGRKLIKIETVKRDTGEPVLIAEAEVEQATTAYMFTGQGSQEQGMGMALYDSSEVAREVWDRADRHFLATYGISILHIVRNNPKELTVHFGGEGGKKIRENYISMMFETVDDKTHALKQERIFKTIDDTTDHYTFISPNGVLAMTQFTQPALTLMEKAYFEDMKSRGMVSEESTFAGHSLGEYAALASLADVMPVESLVDIVFYRGMTMQVAVPRDEQGRSNYGMVAVNPGRVSASFTDEALRLVVDEIASRTSSLLEIVNFNVINQQYVAAGELSSLDILTNVLNVLKVKKIDIKKLAELMPVEGIKAHLDEIIDEVAKDTAKKPQPIELQRGFAVIPLPGISVPFHSSYLRSGVNPFKNFLSKRVSKNAVKPASLVGKYIPNLTAKPFEISKEYFQEVLDLTGSTEIQRIVENWDSIVNA